MAYSLCVTDRSSSTNRTSVVHLFTGMPASFDVERRVGKLLQSCGKSTEKFLGDKHDLDVHHKTHSSQSYLYCAFIANEATTSIITMEDDDHNGCVNEDLIGGIDDVDNSMMESLFNLSAYICGTNNDDNDDDEVVMMIPIHSTVGGTIARMRQVISGHILLDPTDQQKFSFPSMASTIVCLTGLVRKFLLCF
jgi:hypothetical protein